MAPLSSVSALLHCFVVQGTRGEGRDFLNGTARADAGRPALRYTTRRKGCKPECRLGPPQAHPCSWARLRIHWLGMSTDERTPTVAPSKPSVVPPEEWSTWPDERLLELRICQLGVTIEGSPIEARIADLSGDAPRVIRVLDAARPEIATGGESMVAEAAVVHRSLRRRQASVVTITYMRLRRLDVD